MSARVEVGFENIGQEKWNTLVLQSETNTIFQTYEWHISWWKTFGDNKELFIVCVENKNNLIGIAPLVICREKENKKILRFIGYGASDYLDFIYLNQNKKILDLIFESIKEQSHKWDTIELNFMPSYSASPKNIKGICDDKKLYCLKIGTTVCPALVFGKDSDFIQKVRNKKSLKRHKNYFLKKGNYKTVHLTDKFEIMKYLERFFRQHIERWGVTGIPSLFMDQKNCHFYNELTLNMAGNKWIIFTIVESQGAPLAFHFGFAYNRKFIWYKPSFEISLFKYSPGEVLLKELLDFATLNNFDEFDFTIGDEAFKRRFANEIRENISYRILKKCGTYLFYYITGLIKKNVRKYKIGNSIIEFVKLTKKIYFPELVETLKKNGFARFGCKLLRYLFQKFLFNYNCVLFFEVLPCIPSGKNVELKTEEIKIRHSTIKDLFKVDYFESESRKQKYLSEAFNRFKRGDKCLIGEYFGKLIFIFWLCENKNIYITEVKTNVSIEDNTISIYDVVTIPDYRGKNICPYMLNKVIDLYQDKKKIIYCKSKNIASRRAIGKTGFILKRKYYLLNVLGINIRWQGSAGSIKAGLV